MADIQDRFKRLKPYAPRKFVPQDAVLNDVKAVVPLYESLLGREVTSKEGLERWVLDSSEVDAALGEAGSVLYIEMTCHTDDAGRAKAYQDFVENIEPAVKPLADQLNKRFLELNARFPLDPVRYHVYARSVDAAVKLFNERNVPLETEISLLSQEYQSVCGAMMVDFDGKECTMPQMGKFLLEPDRALRERAWRATSARRLKDKDKLEDIFDKMRALREQVSLNAGFSNFRDYQFKAYQRFDYTPEDCKKYHQTVKEFIVPLKREMDRSRQKMMKLDVVCPWDVAVDPLNRPPLKPFEKVDELINGVGRTFRGLDADLGRCFDEMASLGMLDLESRKGKAPGGYQNTLTEARKPFIFMNAVGVDDDIRTLLHESGHAFHAFLSAHDDLDDYRHAPMEFCEVASMSMELMGDAGMRFFYNDTDARRSTIEHLEGVVSVLTWVAVVDSFQHWIYENPKHTREERRAAWVSINKDLGGGLVDWSGLEEERAYLWHRQLHIFEVPFYYIEYGIAQLGALQIWKQFKEDPKRAVLNYKQALKLGGSWPLPELFEAAGIRFDFSKEMIEPLMADVYETWRKLNK